MLESSTSIKLGALRLRGVLQLRLMCRNAVSKYSLSFDRSNEEPLLGILAVLLGCHGACGKGVGAGGYRVPILTNPQFDVALSHEQCCHDL